jgi:hypothetical protein
MTTEAPPQPETQVATDVEADVDEAAKTPRQMFRYSTWVHVGPGAVDCEAINEQAGTNECSNPLHFHAWCRLPNQFQHREIREKALAAKARKTRLLRDPESDRDVQEREEGQDGDGEPLRPFAHVEHDQRRHSELEAMPEEERPGDEFDELGRHLGRYAEALKQRQEEIVQPKRDALTDKGVNGLVDLVRDQRVNAAGTEEFMHTYSTWSWLVGTLRRPGGKTIWPADPQTLVNVAPEVLDEIRVAFEDLEQTQQRGLEGNA